MRGCEGIKLGWARVNFNYFISEEIFDFIVQAVHLVAEEGWKLLPDYEFEPMTGQWRHRRGTPEPAMSLRAIRYRHGRPSYSSRHITAPEWEIPEYLEQARQEFAMATKRLAAEEPDPTLSTAFESLRWFPLPGEVASELAELRDGGE